VQRFSIVGLIALSTTIPTTGVAETQTTADEIVVTAARTAQTADEALASVSVITRKDIETTQAETVVDLLQHYAGIDAVRSGGPGQQTSIFMRGTNSDHTLVLIDGMPVSSSNTGSYQWENLSLNAIERIEIVRGPRSALYGSEAIGGVIQIFTRKNKRVTAEAIAGSFDTYGANFSGGFGDKTKISINASHKQAEGFSATNSTNWSYDPDNDGYTHKSLGIDLASNISDSAAFDMYAQKSELDNEYDIGTSNTKQELVTARLNLTPSTKAAYRFSAGSYQDVLTSYGSSSSSKITTRRLTAGVQTDRQLGNDNMVVLGLDYRTDQGINYDLGGASTVFDKKVDNTGSFISWRKTKSSGSLELAARIDSHSQFGTHTTGQAAWGRNLANHRKLYLSVGTGFKAPDLNELFHPGTDSSAWIPGCNPCYAGNPALKPEESTNFELGVKRDRGENRQSVSLFYNQINNLIAYEGTNFQAINVSKALTYGLELAQKRQRGQWSIDSQLTLQRAIDESNGTALLRRPNEKLSGRVTRHLKHNSSAMLETLLSGGAVDYGPVTLAGYGVVNAAYNHELNANWRFSVRLNNLFDRKYEVAAGYNTTPRSFLVNLRYQPR
jgi:vitamin B12 transporter